MTKRWKWIGLGMLVSGLAVGARVAQVPNAPPTQPINFSSDVGVTVSPKVAQVQNTPPPEPIDFPSDSGVVDVTAAPYLATPSDGEDDTSAIQSALDDHPSGNTIFFFPPGTYEISATLLPAIDDGVTKRNIFQGAGESLTTLKLTDNLDFQGAVISFRSGAAQFFRNSVRDLTIDIGRGNPQATGLQFNASNQGTVRNVTIRSADGKGKVGLDLAYSTEVGPNLIKQVTINGFDIGIHSRWQTASQTFEDITLRHQNQYGWLNESSQTVFGRRITSINDVTAIHNTGEGKMAVIDSNLSTRSASSEQPPIRNQKAMFLRNVTLSGYTAPSVSHELRAGRGNLRAGGGDIIEYWANGSSTDRRGGSFSLFPDFHDGTLKLPIRELPELEIKDSLSSWSGPHLFGGGADDNQDDTAALQAAIDSGAQTIYLPRGTWQIDGTVILRNQVIRLLGTEAKIVGAGTIELQDGGNSPDPVFLERLEIKELTLRHNSQRTWVIQHLLGGRYVAEPGAGNAFFADVLLGFVKVVKGQQVWARQLNIEGNSEANPNQLAKVHNDGGKVWILGFKTEDEGTQILTTNGGETELIGALHVSEYGTEPRYVTQDARFTAALAQGPGLVQETRGNETRRGDKGLADVYVAARAMSPQSNEILCDNSNRACFSRVGEWQATSSFPGGFLGEDALYTNGKGDAEATFSIPISAANTYQVYVRWMSDQKGQDHSGHARNATFQVIHTQGTSTLKLDQTKNGGKWVSLGSFSFDSTQPPTVKVVAAEADGKVLADAVRFVKQP